jgi:hypothetical protein
VRWHQPLKEIADDGAGEDQTGGDDSAANGRQCDSPKFSACGYTPQDGHIVEICNRRIAEPSANLRFGYGMTAGGTVRGD